MKKSAILITSFFVCALCLAPCALYAANKIEVLKKQIANDDPHRVYVSFNDLAGEFLKENKYDECVSCMIGLKEKNKDLEAPADYYSAYCRYQQLKAAEQLQDWNEYFNKGAAWRQEITAALQNAIAKSQVTDPANIYSRLLLWKLTKETQEGDPEAEFNVLMDACRQFAKHGSDMTAIKNVADQLQLSDRKPDARELYKIYVARLANTQMSEYDLKAAADGFYQEGNVDLAEAVYENYIEKISKNISKERLLAELKEIAMKFSVQSPNAKDLFFAEKMFKKMEEVGGWEAFDEKSIYLRAWNLEKAKDYPRAKEVYLVLLNRFPKTAYASAANYKISVIDAYALGDLKQAKDALEKTSQGQTDIYSISSLYHLGLLNQWEGNFEQAQNYYNKLLENAKEAKEYQEIVKFSQDRLAEIKNKKLIEYNLKLFLDACFKPENKNLTMNKINLQVNNFLPKPADKLSLNATAYAGQTGCMDAQLQYYWSGSLGSAIPTVEQFSFETDYPSKGPKVANLVVVSPSGVVDRSFEIIDVN